MCYAYKEYNGVDVRICRIFNTFGPRMNPDDGRGMLAVSCSALPSHSDNGGCVLLSLYFAVVSNFVKQALEGKQLTVYGDGKQTRSFQYVADLVNGLITLMHSDYDARPVNLGNPQEQTIIQFAEYIQRRINPDVGVVHQPAPKDDPKQRQPDITVAKRELGWEPKWSTNEGLEKTIEYFRHEVLHTDHVGPGGEAPLPSIWMDPIADPELK